MVNESNTAVCFSGHLRTFASNPLLRASTKQNLVDAIAAGGTADVFGVATLESSPRNNYNEREGLMAFVETFKPKRFTTVFESATSSYAQWGGEVPFPTREQMERLQGYYVWQEAPFAAVDVARSQYANVAACFDLVRAHESHERRGKRYDWVARARFDTVWFRPLTAATLGRLPPDRIWVTAAAAGACAARRRRPRARTR